MYYIYIEQEDEMSYRDDVHTKIVQELQALENADTWHEHSKKQLNPILGKLNTAKCEMFAEYLNNRFMDAAMACNAVQMNLNWQSLSNQDKIAFAQNITNTLIQLLNSDIQNNRVTVYKNDGNVYTPTNDYFDHIYKQDINDYITNRLKITVNESNFGLMGLSTTGKLNINLGWEMYKGIELFLMDLRHEMMHLVDIFIPYISALEPEIARPAIHYYIGGNHSQDFDTYYKQNPLELNANLKRREFRLLCQAKLAAAGIEQARNNAMSNVRA